jgi:hypothetical protein
MDKLEKFVNDHRDEFDVYDPNPDLWHKIKLHKPLQNRSISLLWKVAVVLFVFGASYMTHIYLSKNNNFIKQDNADYTFPELRETEKYYSNLIQAKLNEVQTVLVSYPELKNDLQRDLAELDSIYKDLTKDLKDNISNQEVIEAMIQNYRIKLKLLEQIQQELQNPTDKNKKNQGHEL